jgi:hypothetical protein
VGVALDCHAKSVVGEQPCVKSGQCFDIRDRQGLRDVDRLESIGRGGREVDRSKRSVGFVVLEVHNGLEAIDIGVSGAVGLDRAVDGHGQVLRLRVGDNEAVEDELGVIDLLLGHLGDGDQEDHRHNDDNNHHDGNQICPPEPETMPEATTPPRLVRGILRLGNGGLIDVAHGRDVRMTFVGRAPVL